ncbi:hypothetical protein CRENBAI_009229, partial [Crenichthys baileyi]
MDSSELESLKLEAGSALCSLTKGGLIEREELCELEDQGMAELLALKDKITELQQLPESRAAKQTNFVQEESTKEQLRKEITALQIALELSLKEKHNKVMKHRKSNSDGNPMNNKTPSIAFRCAG